MTLSSSPLSLSLGHYDKHIACIGKNTAALRLPPAPPCPTPPDNTAGFLLQRAIFSPGSSLPRWPVTAPTRHALRADAQGAAPRHRFLLPDDVPFPRKLMPPGPRQLPTVGSFHHVLLSCHGGLPHRALRELAGRHVPSAHAAQVRRRARAGRLLRRGRQGVLKTHAATYASRYTTPTMAVLTRARRAGRALLPLGRPPAPAPSGVRPRAPRHAPRPVLPLPVPDMGRPRRALPRHGACAACMCSTSASE